MNKVTCHRSTFPLHCGEDANTHLTNIEVYEFGGLMSHERTEISTHENMPYWILFRQIVEGEVDRRVSNCVLCAIHIGNRTRNRNKSLPDWYFPSNCFLIADAISCSVVKFEIASYNMYNAVEFRIFYQETQTESHL